MAKVMDNGQTRSCEAGYSCEHTETGPAEWAMMNLRTLSNLFILNKLAERVEFENKVQRTSDNMQGQR
jgi:hypothetical protein